MTIHVQSGSSTTLTNGAPHQSFPQSTSIEDRVSVQEAISGSIVDHFMSVVAEAAEQPAIWHNGVSISYGTMNARANQIANTILACTTVDVPLIALLFTQGIDPLVAMMGVMKAGKAYVTLDATAPLEQLRIVLDDAQATIVLTNQQNLAVAQRIANAGYHLINLDELQSVTTDEPEISTTAETRMAVYYTSGSTGKPKGLERNHRFTVRVALRNVETYQLVPGARMAVPLNWQWGMAAEAYYGALLGGATVYLCQLGKHTITDFIQWLEYHQINVAYLPIGFYRNLVNSLHGDENWQALRFIALGGDPLYAADIDAFQARFPLHTTIDYRMGLTEASLVTSIQIDHRTELDGSNVPVGYPCLGQEILIVDEAGYQQGPNQIGEIVVRSRTLSTGYWRNPTLTAEKFLPDPEGSDKRIYHTGDLGRIRPDGLLELLGRKDQMVKIRGYRVEMGAIEALLLDQPTVQTAAVMAHDDATGNKQLVAYLVPDNPPPTVQTLRSALQDQLPAYMIPSHFIMLDALPLTANGKLDRKALPVPEMARPLLDTPFVAPRTPLEAQIATIWETILDVRPIGVCDDFFALGGHSLASLRLATELKHHFGRQIPLTAFLQGSTIEQLATFLQADEEQVQTLASTAAQIGVYPAPVKSTMQALGGREKSLITPYLAGDFNTDHQPTWKQRLLDRCVPYALRTHLFRIWCRNAIVQTYFFRNESQLLSAFAIALGRTPAQVDEVVTTHLTRMLYNRYCRGILARTIDRSLTQQVSIAGQSYLDDAMQAGQGTILVNVHGLFIPHLLPIILKQLGYADFMLYAGKAIFRENQPLYQAFQRYFGTDNEALVIAKFLSLQMDVAQRKLEAGGIVWIAPDGGSGYRTHTLSVLGYQRTFSTGFAELAIQTGAAVIPTRRAIAATGQVEITFLAPLDPGSATTSHEERVQHLMQQYVSFLEETWQLDPANVVLGHMQHFLQGRAVGNAE